METAVWFSRLLGMLTKTYGIGGLPPPANPPLAHESDSQVVIVPSFFAPTLILAKADGRTPAMVNSVLRSRNSLTGLPPLCFDNFVASRPQLSAANLLPNPPPI